jgi:hypothetical protein
VVTISGVLSVRRKKRKVSFIILKGKKPFSFNGKAITSTIFPEFSFIVEGKNSLA